MELYYFNINKDSKGYNEVHTSTCSWLPSQENRVYLGYFSTCQDAIKEAQKQHPTYTFDGCYYCCKPCHKG